MRQIVLDSGDAEAAMLVEILEQDAPEVDAATNWIWRAWQRLHDDRPHYGGGMGPSVPGRIPWTTIMAWARHHNLQDGETAMLDACLVAMDAAYLEWWQQAQATATT